MSSTGLSLPALVHLSPEALAVVVAMCTLVELVAGLVRWQIVRVTPQFRQMQEDHHALKICVAKTNYPNMFVENSKLQRKLLRVEKDIENYRGARDARNTRLKRVLRVLKVLTYGSMVLLFWGSPPVVAVTPAFVWPLGRALSPLAAAVGGVSGAGCVSVVGIITLFQLGVSSRLPA